VNDDERLPASYGQSVGIRYRMLRTWVRQGSSSSGSLDKLNDGGNPWTLYTGHRIHLLIYPTTQGFQCNLLQDKSMILAEKMDKASDEVHSAF